MRMNFIFQHAAFWQTIATLVVNGCAKEDSSPDPLPPYVGTWEAQCSETTDQVQETLQITNAYQIRRYAFNTETFSSLWRVYSTSNCDEDSLVLEVEYGEKFTVGDVIDKSTGATQIDLDVDEIAAFILTSSLVTHANSTGLCDGSWAASTIDRTETHKKTLSTLDCLDGESNVSSGQMIFTSYRIENETLSVGTASSGNDGSSEDKRMKELSTTSFIKK